MAAQIAEEISLPQDGLAGEQRGQRGKQGLFGRRFGQIGVGFGTRVARCTRAFTGAVGLQWQGFQGFAVDLPEVRRGMASSNW